MFARRKTQSLDLSNVLAHNVLVVTEVGLENRCGILLYVLFEQRHKKICLLGF